MFIFKKRTLFIIFAFCVFCAFSLISCKNVENVSSYTIDAVYKEGLIEGKLRYKFVNCYQTAFDHLYFNLHANAYSQNSSAKPITDTLLASAYPNGLSYGGIEIESVEILGKKQEFEISEDFNFLKVFIPTVYQGEEIELDITFKTTLPNSTLRLGENDYAVNLADFFPTACKIENGEFLKLAYTKIGDPYFSSVSDYVVNLTVPSEYVVASCGTPILTQVDDFTTTYSYELKSARDFACALSKNFKVFSQNYNDVTVNYYCFSDEGESLLNLAVSALKFYMENVGSYPYKTLSLAETGFVYGGMEFSSLCFISTTIDSNDKADAIIHEIAHQWWYGGVSSDQYNSAYVDEGLAEFSSYLFIKNTSPEQANERILNTKLAYKSFFDIKSVINGEVNTSMERPLTSFLNEYEYVNLAYNKSLLMFFEYQNLVGQDKTLRALKNLYKNNYGKEIGRYEIIKEFGFSDHFNSYIDGKVII